MRRGRQAPSPSGSKRNASSSIPTIGASPWAFHFSMVSLRTLRGARDTGTPSRVMSGITTCVPSCQLGRTSLPSKVASQSGRPSIMSPPSCGVITRSKPRVNREMAWAVPGSALSGVRYLPRASPRWSGQSSLSRSNSILTSLLVWPERRWTKRRCAEQDQDDYLERR